MSVRDTAYAQTLFPSLMGDENWGAEFSMCGLYRYALWRVWDASRSFLVVILLNPSTATHEVNDPTIVRCIARATAMGYGGLIVLNAFAWRDTDPAKMKAAFDPIGIYNDEVILEYCNAPTTGLVLCGWGKDGAHRQRDAQLLAMLRDRSIEPWALGFNGDGSPKHPLYVPYSAKLVTIPPKVLIA